MPESQKDKRKKVSGLVRKHLPEIEKRLVEGDTRDIILDWIRAETGMDIPKTTFIKALYRARQWAKIRTVQTVVVSAQPIQPVAPAPLTQKKPKKEKKSEQQPLPEEDGRLSKWRACKDELKKSDPIEIIKILQKEGKIKS